MKTRKVKFTYQSENADCGLASCYMALTGFGLSSDFQYFKQKHKSSSQGMFSGELVTILESYGLKTEAKRVEGRVAFTNAIIGWGTGHFALMINSNQQGCEILDPATGRMKVSWDDFYDNFSGFAIIIHEGKEIRETEATSNKGLLNFAIRSKGYKNSLIQITMLSLFALIAFLVTPQILKNLLEKSYSSFSFEAMMIGVIAVIGLSLLGTLVSKLTISAMSQHRYLISLHIQKHINKKMMSKSVSYFEKRGVGSILMRLSSVRDISLFAGKDTITIMVNILVVLMTLVLMSIESGVLTIIFLGLVLCLILFQKIYVGKLISESVSISNTIGQKDTINLNTVRNLKPILASSKEYSVYSNILKTNTDYINRIQNFSRLIAKESSIVDYSVIVIELVILWVASVMLINGSITYGSLMAYFAYKSFAFGYLNKLLRSINRLLMLKSPEELSKDLFLSHDEELEHLTEKKSFNNKVSKLSVRDICVKRDGKNIIDNFSADFKSNELTVIKGSSGRGKTTLVKALSGIIKHQSGSIIVGSETVDNLCTYKDLCSLVTQGDSLFKGTVLENVTFFESEVDEKRLIEACEMADVLDVITSAEGGFNRRISPEQISFSGGEVQRILLARAIYRDTPILILDEATSNLDQKSEIDILKNLKGSGRIIIMIAHRENCLKLADSLISI